MLVFSSLSTVVLLTVQRPMRLSAAHDPFAHQPQHINQQRHSRPPHTVIIISIIYSSIEKLSKVTHTKYKYKKHRNRTTMDTHTHTRGIVVSRVRQWTKLTHVGPGYNWDGWPSSGGYTISGCNQPTRSTQPCIPPGSLNRVPASAGVKAGMSPLPGGR